MKRLFMYLAALLIRLGAVYLVGWLVFCHWWAALLFTAAVLAVLYTGSRVMGKLNAKKLLNHAGKEAPVLKTADGFVYRDLNKNGKFDVYEDSRQPIEARVEDLLSRMTLEEKAAQMLSPMVQTTPGNLTEKGSFLMPSSPLEAVQKYGAATLDCSGAVTPREFAEWQNSVQKLAEKTRLGIPVTIASDPRHTYVDESNPLANMQAKGVSSWPIPLGLAAARSEELTAQYAEILRKELDAIMEQCPTIVCLKMNRAAVIPEIAEKATAIFAVFGVKESILMEAIFGKFAPTGKLPFHMARSEEAVRRKGEDAPLTDEDSLYSYGFGLTYENKKE